MIDDSAHDAGTRRRAMQYAAVTRCLDGLGHGALIPVVPFQIEAFGGSSALVTAWIAVYPATYIACAAAIGRWSDRVGRRPIIIAGAIAGAVGYALLAQAGDLVTLFVARVLTAIGGTNATAAGAVLLDVSRPREQGKMMALRGASFGVGVLLGPVAGALAARHSPALPAAMMAVAFLAYALAAWRALPETLRPSARPDSDADSEFDPRTPGFTAILGAYVLVSCALALIYSLLPLLVGRFLAQHDGGADDSTPLTSLAVCAWGITAAAVQLGITGRAIATWGPRRALQVSVLVWSVFAAALPAAYAAGLVSALLITVLAAIPYGMTQPALNSLIAQAAPRAQGRALGLGDAADASGFVIGAAVAGLLFQLAVPLPYWLSAALLIAAAGLVTVSRGVEPHLVSSRNQVSHD
jgi:MFS transporter, DHA1 family, tetracycline resistance protein